MVPLEFSDADLVEDFVYGKSTSGYVFMMHCAEVSWCSRKETVTSTSSCEAQYIALSIACNDAVWFKRIVLSLSRTNESNKVLKLICDS